MNALKNSLRTLVALITLLACLSSIQGYSQDSAEAVKWWRKAAEQGDADAQYNLGYYYAWGLGVPEDDAEAVKWYRLAAEQGYAKAQFNLGVSYDGGEGVPQDYKEAVKWYRKAAEQGYAAAQSNLGVCYDNGDGVPQDSAEAVKWWRKAAEQGQAGAQTALGSCYYNGRGVSQDYKEAVKWYRMAAEQGYAKAQNSLGGYYAKGKGVPQDYAEAVKWYRMAAEQGYAKAQNSLGGYYAKGKGVPQDYAEAVKWYRMAAEQGDAKAQNNLGMCYRTGEGVPQDHAEALKWVRLAVEQGDAVAQCSLGEAYRDGLGVPQDDVMALKWFNTAIESGGYEEAKTFWAEQKTFKAELLERMTRAQIAEVEALSGAVDGYDDLKFGMTSEEAQATEVVKNGKVLFGEKRNVGFGTDKSGKVFKILIQLGDYDEEIRNKIVPILSKKYQLISEPDDKDFDAYNQEGLTPEEKLKKGLSYDAVGTILGIQIDDLALRNVSWDFAAAQVSFVIGKMIDDRKSTKYLTVYKDVMYVAYRNQITADPLVSKIRAKQQKRNTKTTSDDF